MKCIRQQVFFYSCLLFPQLAFAGGGELGYLLMAWLGQMAIVGTMLGLLSMKSSITSKKHFMISTWVILSVLFIDLGVPFLSSTNGLPVWMDWLLSNNTIYILLILFLPVLIFVIAFYIVDSAYPDERH